MVGIAKAEGPAALGVPIAAVAGNLHHVVGRQTPVGLRRIDLADPGRVGRHGNVVVGDATAAHTAPRASLPGPMISISQTSFGSAMVGASPMSHQPCSLRRSPAMRIACRAVVARSSMRRVRVSQSTTPFELTSSAATERRFADSQLPLVHGGIGRSQIAKRFRDVGDAALGVRR